MYAIKHTNVICVTRNAPTSTPPRHRRERRGLSLKEAHEARHLEESARAWRAGTPRKRTAAVALEKLLLKRLNLESRAKTRHEGAARHELYVGTGRPSA